MGFIKGDITCATSKLLLIILITSFLFLLLFMWGWRRNDLISHHDNEELPFVRSVADYPVGVVDELTSAKWKKQCLFFNCFDINMCRYGNENEESIKVYVYSTLEVLTNLSHSLQSDWSQSLLSEQSDEYLELIETIKASRYYEPHPQEACVFVSPTDTLNGRLINNGLITLIFNNLKYWNNGSNHVIFSMLPWQQSNFNSSTPDYNYGMSVIAGGAFTVNNYRTGFDITIPVFNPLTRRINYQKYHNNINSRQYLLIILVQPGADPFITRQLTSVLHDHSLEGGVVKFLWSRDQFPQCNVGERCSPHGNAAYPDILQDSKYCMIVNGIRRGATPDLLDILMMGCVPVIIRDYEVVLPFSEVLDWNRLALFVWLQQLSQLMPILLAPGGDPLLHLRQKQVLHVYSRYFHSMSAITMTTLDILNERVFPFSARSYEEWNGHDGNQVWNVKHSHIKLPSSKPEDGFTAVILAYDRIDKLFQTVKNVAQAPSLAKVVVVWNNIFKLPPPMSDWPLIDKPLNIIRTKENKLSNRFYPYSEIQTAAVLSLDDDLAMMSSDEIEFGFQTWLEYPDRLVGYPGRVHRYNTGSSNWVYDTEWTNEISVVLTGAAFYHKYYHYHYTHLMPQFITQWVDNHFNCEDIMFNFMISNLTGLPPLKVTPRKRFKCPSCNTDGLVGDSSHYAKRTECLNLFAKHFGDSFPLKTVKYRLDPVLYKVKSKGEKAFPKVGEL